jgi:chemotaxis protein MotB
MHAQRGAHLQFALFTFHFSLFTPVPPALRIMKACRIAPFLIALAGLAAVPREAAAQAGRQTPLNPKQASTVESLIAQVQDLARRVRQLDADNRDLNSRLAQELQEKKLMADQLAAARERLAEAGRQMQTLQSAWQASQQNLAAATRKAAELEAERRRLAEEKPASRVGAVLTANNSVRQNLRAAEIPGFDVRQHGDLIRIEAPSDRLFRPGTSELLPEAYAALDQIAAAIVRNYPRQIVGIEGYWDNSGVGPAGQTVFSSAHQLTASQALAIFDQFTGRNRLPARQLYIMGQGANHPRASNATPAGQAKNRRVELVIYPETYDDAN